MDYGLQFNMPASEWLEAFPLGNGHIGVMLHGGTERELLCLNDDTLWSGCERHYAKPDFRDNLEKARELISDNRKRDAQNLIEHKMLGPFSQAYLPLGDILIDFSNAGPADPGYKRELSFADGIARIDCAGVHRECFCNYPSDVMVYRIENNKPDSFAIGMKSQLKSEINAHGNDIEMGLIAPGNIIVDDVSTFHPENNIISYEEADKSLKAGCLLRVETDGQVTAGKDRLFISDATQTVLFYTSATTFENKDPAAYCARTIKVAVEKGFQSLRAEHLEDFSSLYRGVEIDLGGKDQSTEEIWENCKQGIIDGFAVSTLFQYGRYLLLSSSRAGTQAANLQGIWNKDLIPPWWSNYTLNINLQMNYWLAHRTNLAACVLPLHTCIRRLVDQGKITAETWYGMRGSVSHHQSDIWGLSSPVGFEDHAIEGSAAFAMWNMSGPWLCLHLYEHYLYSRDRDFLNESVMYAFTECFLFIKDYLVEVEGVLNTIPSTSPENSYYGAEQERLAICVTSAMDIGILTEFLNAFLALCEITADPDLKAEAEQIVSKLQSYKTDQGFLLEWDGVDEEADPGHRHFSPLFGVYPGSHLLPEYKEQAKNVLLRRMGHGSGSTGWSAAWGILLFARLEETDYAWDSVRRLMSRHLHKNLFGAHPPGFFQIDANFGFTAAIAEMLLQDYDGVLCPLPALPANLRNGDVRGLRTRDGHTIDIIWREGQVQVALWAARDERIQIWFHKYPVVEPEKPQNGISISGNRATIQAKKEVEYKLVGRETAACCPADRPESGRRPK